MSVLNFPAVSVIGQTADEGSVRKMTARTIRAQFGRAYTQRQADGLNTVTAKYSISWTNLSHAEATTIDNFLTERAGWQAFNYTPPGESLPRMWVCEEWAVKHENGLYKSISAEFVQVFAPT